MVQGKGRSLIFPMADFLVGLGFEYLLGWTPTVQWGRKSLIFPMVFTVELGKMVSLGFVYLLARCFPGLEYLPTVVA